jgi:hypothetical protein
MNMQREFVDNEGNGRRERKRLLFFFAMAMVMAMLTLTATATMTAMIDHHLLLESDGMIAEMMYFSFYI